METDLKEEQIKDLDTKETIDNFNSLKKEKGDSTQKLNKQQKINIKLTNDKSNEAKKTELYNQVTQEDLQKLCDQLSAFNQRIQNARAIIHLRYDLPLEMRDKLESEAGELECLYKELQSCVRDLEITRNQRHALGQEKQFMETQVAKLKADVTSELEVIVSVYDSSMMERWEDAKASDSIPTLQHFLHDVKGKLEAMKNLQILGTQKLADLQNKEKKMEEKTIKNEDKKKKNNKEERRSSRSYKSSSNRANSSQTSVTFLLDTDSEETVDDSDKPNLLYSLVCDQVLSLPAWTQNPLDID